jgi:pimeloyl-ACP methyl ester carboxylesterase
MIIDVDDVAVHAATGGVDPTGDHPLVVLVHGAGMDGTVWQLQTRYLAHHDLRPLAVDLPGHGRTPGPPLGSIGEMADWLARFVEAAAAQLDGAPPVHIVGHSMGTFIGLELAARRSDLVASLALLGTANAMPVHPDLVAAAGNDLPAAAALMTAWGHDRPAHVGRNPTPGLWMLGGARALVEASPPGSLLADFEACAAYDSAAAAAAKLTCPVAVAIGLGDKMTPPRAAAKLIAELADPTVVELPDTGHMMMTENPRAVRELLLAALTH